VVLATESDEVDERLRPPLPPPTPANAANPKLLDAPPNGIAARSP
jgi:hypothetical protein